MTIDAFTIFNELDLLEIRLNILDAHVDKFIIVESHQTFSGIDKPLYYEENKERFAKWSDKIIHLVVPNMEVNDGNLFRRHYLCYEAIEKTVLEICLPNDIVYCSDIDEIWKPQEVDDQIHSLTQRNYSYWMNYLSNEEWTGTLVSRAKNIFIGYNKMYRTVKPNILPNGGWHFSNIGGVEQIIKKLEAYDHSNEVIPGLSRFEGYGIKARMENGYDFLGRELNYQGKPYAFELNEEDLPPYLLENREQWKHLLKS
jgi:hypothetical protein